ncbi:glycosyltransferase family 4 protein [bacterium]|nr:glycosyltransferase family 4 protein [bacterium]
MKRITILALHLGYGGIEKCISTLANTLCKNYQVNVISTYKLYEKPSFPIDDRVKITYLIPDLSPSKNEFIDSVKHLKFIKGFKLGITNLKVLYLKKKKMIEAIKNCDSDVIISTRDIHNDWLGKYGNPNILKIGWEHNHHNNDKKYINKIIKSVSKLDYFVLVSKELEEFYRQKVKCKTVYIPNTLDYYPKKVSDLEEKRIISVGRLSEEKGYLDLIDVFSLVHQVYPDWKLDIIGDGNQKENIQKKIEEYGLKDFIILHGFQNKEYINQLLQKSSIYVMCSYTESFGIVLLEAFSFGIPCVAFDSARGATEIISNNWDGYLIKDRNKEIMAKKVCELISNPNRRIIMGANGIKKANQYSMDEIRKYWIQIIETVK